VGTPTAYPDLHAPGVKNAGPLYTGAHRKEEPAAPYPVEFEKLQTDTALDPACRIPNCAGSSSCLGRDCPGSSIE